MIRLTIILLISLFSVVGYSQHYNPDLIKKGNNAYDEADYTTAAFYYQKALVEQHDSTLDVIYPYSYRYFEQPLTQVKKEKLHKKNDSLIVVQDSIALDSVVSIDYFVEESDSGQVKFSLASKDVEIVAVAYKLAECYRFMYSYDEAELWYGVVNETKNKQYQLSSYWYGHMLMRNGKYDEAVIALNEYVMEYAEFGTTYFDWAERDIQNCAYAQKLLNAPPTGIEVELSSSWANSSNSSFGTAYYGVNEVVFTMARTPIKDKRGEIIASDYSANLFKAGLSDGELGDISPIGTDINSESHEGTPAITPDGSKMFFTKWNIEEGKTIASIYLCKYFMGNWLTPQKLQGDINLEGFNSMHPSIANDDGSLLYFTSDRPGGEGRLDIWMVSVDNYGVSGVAENLGYPINTKDDEKTPFYHIPSDVLYFSSNGREGMGGLDIYKAYPDQGYSSPIDHMGYPINSSRDDAYFVLDESQEYGFLSSDRFSCESCQSSNCLKIFNVKHEPMLISIEGYVFDAETNEPITNSMVKFSDVLERIEDIFLFTDDDGYYYQELRPELAFYATAQKTKYFKDAADVSTEGILETTIMEQDFYLKPARDFILPIQYDYDKSTLRPESKIILDDLTVFLKLNNNMIIEIGSHTDERGEIAYNQKLSQERAQSVYDYLIAKGIDEGRLERRGYGETDPIFKDAADEEEHQHNRRTEFKILSEDYYVE